MNNKIRIDKKNIKIFGTLLLIIIALFIAFFTYRYVGLEI